MGCFNHKGNFSNLPITYGDRIVVIVGVRPTKKTNIGQELDDFSPGHSFVPISVPIRGEYDDYGGIENIDRTPAIDELEKFFSMETTKLVDLAERTCCGCEDQMELENLDGKVFKEFEFSDVEVFMEFETSDGKHYTDKTLAEEHQKELNIYNDNSKKIYSVKDVRISKETIQQYFYQMKCAECPFGKECRDMEDRVRRHTTSTFSLCSTITNSL